MVGIATARPMTQRHRRRRATLARKNISTVFGREQAKVKHVGKDIGLFKNFAGNLQQPKCLGHLAGTGAIVARRTADQQHARRARRIGPAHLRLVDALLRRHPFCREVVLRIVISSTRLLGDRCLAALAIGLPGDLLKARDRLILGFEGWILECRAKPCRELIAPK